MESESSSDEEKAKKPAAAKVCLFYQILFIVSHFIYSANTHKAILNKHVLNVDKWVNVLPKFPSAVHPVIQKNAIQYAL